MLTSENNFQIILAQVHGRFGNNGQEMAIAEIGI
jgi:hypothetical protein